MAIIRCWRQTSSKLEPKIKFFSDFGPTWLQLGSPRGPKGTPRAELQGSGVFLYGFFVFFRGRERKGRISKNIDLLMEKLIFSRVQGFKIGQKSIKIRFWRLNFDFGGQKLAKMSTLEAKKTILEAKKAVLEAKRPILEAKIHKLIQTCCLFDEVGGMWRPLAKLEPGEFSL